MTGARNKRFDRIAQSVGNIIIPFFGGVPATAAIARTMLDRGGLTELIRAERIFWSADQAIVAAEALVCPYCQVEQQTALVQGPAAASAG